MNRKVLQIVVASRTGSAFGNSVIGPERRAANLIRRWSSVEIEPVVCYPRRGNLWKDFAEHAPTEDFEIGSKFNLYALRRIAKIARRHQVDLIHTQGPPSLDLLAVLAGRLIGRPVVVTRPVMIYEHIYYAAWRLVVYDWLDSRITLKAAARLVAVSQHGYEYIGRKLRGHEDRLRLIHNGVSLNRFRLKSHSAYSGLPDQPPVTIGMVAQLIVSKGWWDFLSVVELLKREGLNIQALVVGEGEERPNLERWVRDHELTDCVRFLGYQADVAPLYQVMDMLLFTTHQEGLSVAVIEALASGLPIVATDVGGIRDQVTDGTNGHVARCRDVQQMTSLCRSLVTDPALRDRMGSASRAVAERKFNEDRMLTEYAACYREAIGSL